MHQGVKWMLVAAGSGVLLAGAVYGMSAWRGASPAQRAALAEMERPVALPGRNAFAAAMLLRYPLGDGELATLERPEPWEGIAVDPVTGMPPKGFERQLVGDRAPFEPDPGGAPCGGDGPCLAAVEADTAGAEAWIGTHRDWIDRVDRLSDYGHYRPLRPDSLMWPDMLGGAGVALQADRALRFVKGERALAMSQVCGDIGAWRRLVAHSESLAVWSSARGIAEGQMALFAEMLDRWPRGDALPSTCGTALAPPAQAEMSICTAMRGEYQLGRAMRSRLEDESEGQLAGLFYRADMTEASAADAVRRACDGDGPDADRHASRRPMFMHLECIRNAAGCILTDIAEPTYATYVDRAKAFGDHLRLAATLAWLHDTDAEDAGPLAERVAARPAALRGAAPVDVVAGGSALEVKHQDVPGAPFRLPVPRRLRD